MLKSLPACSFVLNKKMELVDINQPALKLLKIDDINDFQYGGSDLFFDALLLKATVLEMKKGKTVKSVKTMLKCPDGDLILAELCACMVNGVSNLFLFQFFEVPLLHTEDLLRLNSNAIPTYIEPVESQQRALSKKSKNNSHQISRLIEHPELESVENGQSQWGKNATQLIRRKRRELSTLEMTVSNLVDLDLSLKEISNMTNKSVGCLRSIIRRIVEKQKLESRQELSGHLP